MMGLRDRGGGSLQLSRSLAATLAATFTVAFFLASSGAVANPSASAAAYPHSGSGSVSGTETERAARYSLQIGMRGTGSGTVQSEPSGINCRTGVSTGCLEDFDEGVRVKVSPKADPGSVFTGWTGASVPPYCITAEILDPLKCEFTMERNTALIANFASFDAENPPLAVFKQGNGTGTVTSSPSGINCDPGCEGQTRNFPKESTVTLTAAPEGGAVFTGWRGACTGTSPTCTVTMEGAQSAFAIFTLKRHGLTVVRSGDGSGTVISDPAGIDCGSACIGEFDHGTTVKLVAAPRVGSAFVGWSGICSGSGSTCEVKMEQVREVVAAFSPEPVPPEGVVRGLTVTKSTTGSGRVTSSPAGIDCGTVCMGEFEDGAKVTLTAKPDSGSVFTGWSGACAGAVATCEVTMSEERMVTATFAKAADPKVPPNPPNNSTAIYDPATGKLKIRLKCASHYRPKCIRMIAQGVSGKKRTAKKLTDRIKVKNRNAGKWKHATLTVRKKFRQKVENMGRKSVKTLWVRIKLTFRKKKKVTVRHNGGVRKVQRKVKATRMVHHRYRVLVRR